MSVSDRTVVAIRFSVVLILLVGSIDRLPAEEAIDSDQWVMNQLFGDHNLARNVIAIRKQAADYPLPARYDFLRDWVLPSETHNSIRLAAAFVPAEASLSSPGGTLVSPALDLVAMAAELNRLTELRTQIEAISFEDEIEQRDRLALLFLISLSLKDFENALLAFDELSQRLELRVYPELCNRWPETLVLWKAAELPELHAAIAPVLNRILTTQTRTGVNCGPDAWDRHLTALTLRVNNQLEANRRFDESMLNLQNWHLVSHGDCVTRAHGFPRAFWERQGNEVVNLVSRHEDYLYYRIPLTGDFEVECDLGGFGYRDTEMMVHGLWVVPQFDHQNFALNDLHGERKRFELATPLSQTSDWIHHRVIVKDQTCTLYMNGREVYRQKILKDASPWLAIRSPFYGQSRVRDVHISGNPIIPEELSLSANRELAGWLVDNPDAVPAGGQTWRFIPTLGPEGGIVSPIQHDLRGSFHEDLLRYERPLFEDSHVEYEFYYQEHQAHVHPALGRRIFLLTPDGVQIHRLTDGVWDRSGLDPKNVSVNEKNEFRADSLPLQAGWNHLQMTLNENRVFFELNGTPVYREQLDKHNFRTFGLFHYADQTEARVRNVRYRGNWPKEVPPVAEQDLHDTRIEELDAGTEALNDEVTYSFLNRQYDSSRFFLYDSGKTAELMPLETGLKMHQPGSKEYSNTWIAPRIRVTGDFDIEAEFEQLNLQISEHGGTSVYLTVVTTDKDTTHAHVNRGVFANPNERGNSNVQVEFNLMKPKGVEILFEGRQAEESTAGRLRIARRGKTTYFLFAESDSPVYRIFYEQEVNDSPLMINGIRLAAGTWAGGKTLGDVSVVWKRLSVKAEMIQKLP